LLSAFRRHLSAKAKDGDNLSPIKDQKSKTKDQNPETNLSESMMHLMHIDPLPNESRSHVLYGQAARKFVAA
jgi:mRNA-degrading endonuclease YafQ of YafQ-DinJ toxin-antitoxin module